LYKWLYWAEEAFSSGYRMVFRCTEMRYVYERFGRWRVGFVKCFLVGMLRTVVSSKYGC
jgi:hypothetical protein